MSAAQKAEVVGAAPADASGHICPACGSAASIVRDGIYVHCVECGTIRVPTRMNYVYDDSYPADRGHFQDNVARCKQVTLRSWLGRLNAPLSGRRVLEVGFGSGATLSVVEQQGGLAHGVEPVAANREGAVRLGIPAERVTPDLATFAGHDFDVVLYLDSFEHILDPHAHLQTLRGLTKRGSKALLVLPSGDSVSRRFLGRWWPHDLADHWVFYSKLGLVGLWREYDWTCVHSFYPWKYISLRTAALHWEIKTHIPLPSLGLGGVGIWLNFGELGLIFERQ